MSESKKKSKPVKISEEKRTELYTLFLELMVQRNALGHADAELRRAQAEVTLFQSQRQTIEQVLASMDAELKQAMTNLKVEMGLPPDADFDLKSGTILYPGLKPISA